MSTHLKVEILVLVFLFSCEKEISYNEQVYFNDFETLNLDNISGGKIAEFNGNNIIGNYNNEGFQIKLNNLPEHNFIKISHDLLIHDSWDGNNNGVDGPDIWGVYLDTKLSESNSSTLKFESTFSNSVCNAIYCLQQSYPNVYPNFNNPKTGAIQEISGFCNQNNITSIYRIEKIFPHSKNNLTILFWDQLRQSNSNQPQCDESWSLDNLEIRLWEIN